MIDVTLTVGGNKYGGWKAIEISLSLEQIAGQFKLRTSDRWHGQEEAWPIIPGDACTVAIGDRTVITGYVDEANPEYDHKDHGIEVNGRDKTGDLVDCAAIYKTGEWLNADLKKIAFDLCAPFGVSVWTEVDIGKKFPKFALQEGETVFEALERASRMRGVLLVSDGRGHLVLTRASDVSLDAALIRGVNIEAATGCFSHKERFSWYIIKGQVPGASIFVPQDLPPEQRSQLKATSEDAEVTRYRPLIIYAEQGDGSTYKDRAVWERNVRAGRAARVQYTVTGWEYKPGAIWIPNRLVRVQDSYTGVDAELLIVRCTYLLDDGGSRTRLELCRPEAFDLINLPNMKRLSALGKTLLKGTKDSKVKDKEPLKW